MPKIMLTPEFLTEKAAEVANCRETQQQIISGVASLIEGLVAGWEGAAQKAFQAAFEERKGAYDQFAPDLTAFSDFLTSYATTMEDIDVGEANRAGGLTAE